jgi:predicted ATPase
MAIKTLKIHSYWSAQELHLELKNIAVVTGSNG